MDSNSSAEIRKVDPALSKPVVIADVDDAIARNDARLDALQGRWILALAVANSAGLTALGAKVFDVIGGSGAASSREFALALALPSLWMFVAGVVAAGFAHIGSLIEALFIARRLRRHRREILEAGDELSVEMGPRILSWWDWVCLWFWEAISATAFVAGLTYPLLVFSIRYFRNGVISLG